MKLFFCRYASRFCIVTLAILALLMSAPIAHASDGKILWHSRDQFVKLERQDSDSADPAQLNDHPADLTQDRLTEILSSIDMRASDGGKTETLFTKPAVQILVPYLVQGLHQAASGEDVTFAVIGLHDALFGLAKSPKVTTGRLFYKAGKLNIIVGLVQKDVNEREDRRLSPFTPGSRHKIAEGEWTILPQSGQNGFTLVRKDWMTFGEEWRAPVSQYPAAEKKVPSAQVAPPAKLKSDMRGPAERLTTLNELRDKGLVSEEEYRSKRLEILNGL